jgi:hypothetical protein
LQQLGLKTDLDGDTFLCCAERVERMGQLLDQASPVERTEVVDVAAGLARHLATHFGPVHERTFLDRLSSIAFVPATKVTALAELDSRSQDPRSSGVAAPV